jgi:hypothetical protein
VRRAMLAAVVAAVGASSLVSQEAAAEWWNLPDGIDNPRPRYYDYHPPGVFYRNPGPVGFSVSGYLAAPYPATPGPGYGVPGYGFVAALYPAPAPATGGPGYGNGGAPYAAAPGPVYRVPAYGYVATPYPAAPGLAYGNAGSGYVAAPNATPGAVVPVVPRPLCGVYRYWREGVCVDRRGY